VNAFLARPSVLSPVHAPKAWGWERWLTSTRPEGPASVTASGATLVDAIRAQPEALGSWTRSLFGAEMPIFTKFIHTDFPQRVHLGFKKSTPRGQFLDWLSRDQDSMRALLRALRTPDENAFGEYQSRYSRWATEEALSGWQKDDDDAAASLLAPFVDPSFALRAWLRDARQNRAAIVDTLNEIDLRAESGHLFLSSAGIVHAIFGLSHQTHPRDPARQALERLFASLADRATALASDAELARAVDAAGLPELRASGAAPPKNEAWLATNVDGQEVLVEPQQTSDTTYSLADFYTPFTWGGDGARFRKGDARSGLSRDKLDTYLDDVVFEVTSLDAVRRSPKVMPGSREDATLSCLIDEPARWPFFTAYQLDLQGKAGLSPPPGLFQQIVVTRGRVALSDASGPVGELAASAPAFVPATLDGGYVLSAREASTVFLLSVPAPRGVAPRLTALTAG
jgi:hypothetical protein